MEDHPQTLSSKPMPLHEKQQLQTCLILVLVFVCALLAESRLTRQSLLLRFPVLGVRLRQLLFKQLPFRHRALVLGVSIETYFSLGPPLGFRLGR